MPLISNIEILEKPEQPIIFIRVQTSVSDLPKAIGSNYEKLEAYLKKNGRYLADIPFVSFYSFEDMNNMDVAMGFPLAAPLKGGGEIESGVIAAGKVISCMYLGPYDQMGPVYDQVMKQIEEKGYKLVYPTYEFYYNGPEVPAEHYLTELR
ncbi:MAG: GyrI-like domain-containing protein, partial [Methanosarcinales archaeon]|nr:GyrI-like domain-containing protein [Methanosarcinales archaeon]